MRGLVSAEQVSRIALQALATKGRLALDASRLHAVPLLRDGVSCGLYFSLQGPRNVLLTAIWDSERQTLWCYDSRGDRFEQITIDATSDAIDEQQPN